MITLLTALLIGVTNVGALTTLEFDSDTIANAVFAEPWIGVSTTNTLSRVTVDDIIDDMEDAGITEEVVKKLAAGGHVCAVFGHRWKEIISVDGFDPINYEVSTTRRRKCAICGKQESKTEGDWK